ncbi:MAG: hypothetical protein HQK66_04000 [Desulfamplus sp.]|nr:hypothetical protein [Desulfamplus sp.]
MGHADSPGSLFYKSSNLFMDGKDNFIKSLAPGDICGDDTFFDITNCTYTVTAASISTVSFIERDMFKIWDDDLPALKGQLMAYCQSQVKISDVINAKKIERRAYKRIRLEGKADFQILKASGTPLGKVYRGFFYDISVAGISFTIKSSRKETLRMLLGRRIHLQFDLNQEDESGKENLVKITGSVIGVNYHYMNEFFVSVKLENLLREDTVMSAHRLLKPQVRN